MRRTKEWWARLSKDERSLLVQMERADKEHGSSYNLPCGYSDCTWCSTPCSGAGICGRCLDRLIELIKKADGREEE